VPSDKEANCGIEGPMMWHKGAENVTFACLDPNDRAIADELRYLRKEIETLKK